MNYRIRSLAVAGVVALGWCSPAARAAPPVATPQTTPVTVKIIGFNDYHGNLQSPGTFGVNTVPGTVKPPVGGAEYLAAYIARMKATNRNTVVVGAGDFVGASPLISALFYDEPAIETLNKIGVDIASVGNHEFDKGKDELRRLQNGGCKITNNATDPNSCLGYGSSAPGTFDGAKFKYLSANVVEEATGRTLFPAYEIKTIGGARIAFIGLTLQGTPGIVTPTGVAGLSFKNEADTVNALVPQLRTKDVEAIVVLVHQGGFQNKVNGADPSLTTTDINGCVGNLRNTNGTLSDIAAIVSQFDDAVDLVISGHTHAAYNCSANTVDVNASSGVATPRPTGIANKVGRLLPVTSASAFGRVLTEVDMTVDRRTGHVMAVSPKNVLADQTDPAINAAIAADPTVANIVAAYNAAVSPLANQVIATITAPMTNAANAAGEMEAGDLIADAQLQATQPANLGGAVIALMNAGGVRNPGFVSKTGSYPYDVTYGDAFTVQPFGNSLVTMTLTAQQIKDVLEQQFSGCKGQTAQRIMQVSVSLHYTWNSAGTCGTRITGVAVTPTDLSVVPAIATGPTENLVISGVVQNPTKTYRVTVNNFMATGGDGFSTFVAGQNQQGGAQDIDALVAYLTAFKSPSAPYDPASVALTKPRITRQ